jgi:hypothetical protein
MISCFGPAPPVTPVGHTVHTICPPLKVPKTQPVGEMATGVLDEIVFPLLLIVIEFEELVKVDVPVSPNVNSKSLTNCEISDGLDCVSFRVICTVPAVLPAVGVIVNVAEALTGRTPIKLFIGVVKVIVVDVARRDGATLRAAVIIKSIASFIGRSLSEIFGDMNVDGEG